ncbi:MAG TPA: potassium/proton antiporter [Candidatus Cybelea sp.]|nr:potassium/proton antiporter [Candidatus Cybelea sp.]
MHFGGPEIVFFAALLVVVSILASTLSNRIGAPLLLVFLLIGMLVGEDGFGGVRFDDYNLAYIVGSLALAVILFDGGLRSTRRSFEVAAWPALMLAVPGVVVTAALTAVAATWLLKLDWTSGFLVGAIMAPTDAAAVFILLRHRDVELKRRVGATLEIESGLNDPMAIFLTFAAVQALQLGHVAPRDMLLLFAGQMFGGVAIGAIAAYFLVLLINRIEIAGGLYPVLAGAFALAIFGGAQAAGASGFLAVYIAGFVVGNLRHRAAKSITRFHDGVAWLAQIGMFLMLGLLVTPHRLVYELPASLAIAAVLMFVARPAAVAICLAPFRFTWQEIAFVSWMGLRGAVPIFLATVTVLAGVTGALLIFDVTFVVVLASLLAQGWTVSLVAKALRLVLPTSGDEAGRLDPDALIGLDRDITAYRVAAGSAATERPFARLPLPRRSRVITVIRDGTIMNRESLPLLLPGDYVLAVAPTEQLYALDTMFTVRANKREQALEEGSFGAFLLQGDAPVSALGKLYGFPVPPEGQQQNLAEFLARRLPRTPVIGDRVRIAPVEFVVREMKGNRIARVGLEIGAGTPAAKNANFWQRLTRLSGARPPLGGADPPH